MAVAAISSPRCPCGGARVIRLEAQKLVITCGRCGSKAPGKESKGPSHPRLK